MEGEKNVRRSCGADGSANAPIPARKGGGGQNLASGGGAGGLHRKQEVALTLAPAKLLGGECIRCRVPPVSRNDGILAISWGSRGHVKGGRCGRGTWEGKEAGGQTGEER